MYVQQDFTMRKHFLLLFTSTNPDHTRVKELVRKRQRLPCMVLNLAWPWCDWRHLNLNWFYCLIQPSEFTRLWFSVGSWHENFDHRFQFWPLFDMLFWTDDHIYRFRHLVVTFAPSYLCYLDCENFFVFVIPYSSLLSHHNIKTCRDRNVPSRSSEIQRWWATIKLG